MRARRVLVAIENRTLFEYNRDQHQSTIMEAYQIGLHASKTYNMLRTVCNVLLTVSVIVDIVHFSYHPVEFFNVHGSLRNVLVDYYLATIIRLVIITASFSKNLIEKHFWIFPSMATINLILVANQWLLPAMATDHFPGRLCFLKSLHVVIAFMGSMAASAMLAIITVCPLTF